MTKDLNKKFDEKSFQIPIRFRGKFVALINGKVVAQGKTKEEAEEHYKDFAKFYSCQPVYLHVNVPEEK